MSDAMSDEPDVFYLFYPSNSSLRSAPVSLRFFAEGVTLMFYMLVGYKFRPIEKNPYLQVKGDSDDEDEGLNLEEFGLNEGDDEDEMSNPSTGPNAL